MTRSADILPVSCPPIGLSRAQGAAFICVGTTKFDEMVKDGRMPAPRRVDGRNIWHRHELEEAFASLPSDESANPWDQEDAA